MFDKKGVYQSQLVAATRDGPIDVILTSHPAESKFAGKPKWLGFKVAGNGGGDHQLHIENERIEQILAAQPLNTVLSIQAHGSRDEATITVGSGNGQQARPQRQQSNGNGHSAPQQQNGESRPHAILPQYSECFLASLEIIRRGVEKVPELEGASPDAMLAATKEISATLFIEWNRSAGMRPLRSHPNGEG